LKVYIDFSCPFTNRFHSFVSAVNEEKSVDIEWCSFSLKERNRSGDLPLWEQEELDKELTILALAGLEELKQRDQAAVDAYVDDMFLAGHSQEAAPELNDIQQLLDKYSIVLEQKHFEAVAASHQRADELKVVGSPSLIADAELPPLFMKLDHVPEEPVATWERILSVARDTSVIELKQPS